MKTNYMITLKVNDDVFFSTEKSTKGICEWEMAYEANPDAEEFKVYEKNPDNLTYTLIHSVYKRKIGFQEEKK